MLLSVFIGSINSEENYEEGEEKTSSGTGSKQPLSGESSSDEVAEVDVRGKAKKRSQGRGGRQGTLKKSKKASTSEGKVVVGAQSKWTLSLARLYEILGQVLLQKKL